MLLFSLAVVLGLVGLVWSADRFVDGASATANHLGVSPLVIGMIIVGFGTSAPEMLVAATASWDGSPELAVGNALGSNIANVALILGATALLSPIVVRSRIVKREIPVLLAVCILTYLLVLDGHLGRVDGVVLFVGLILIMGYTYWEARHKDDPLAKEMAAELEDDLADDIAATQSIGAAIGVMLLGLVVLVISSKALVYGASGIARGFGVSELVIGLTIVAVGTSLPELASSFVAAKKGEADIALGNVVGSNLFNTLGVLALPGIIAPAALSQDVLIRDFPIMLFLTVLMWCMAYGYKKEGRINRVEGGVLLVAFVSYQVLLFFQGASH